MHTDQKTESTPRRVRGISSVRARVAGRAAGHRTDQGVSLIEVMVAFAILMIAMIPLSYLFESSVIQAGQSTNQQTGLSVADQWMETLGNENPPTNALGEVTVNHQSAPTAQAASTQIPVAINGVLATSVTTLTVATTSAFTGSGSIKVNTVDGLETVAYTGKTATTFTGVSGWTSAQVNTVAFASVTQGSTAVPNQTVGGTNYSLLAEYEWTSLQGASNGAQPNLCAAGSPALLKVRITVSWGPNIDVNNVQESEVINYPAAGIQSLGFRAFQVYGDSAALDSQANPWSLRVQAPPVTFTETSATTQPTLSIYPDANGCAFAQVEPGTYTVGIANASTGQPFANDTYGSPSFVENALGSVTNNVMSQPTAYTDAGVTVPVGAVTRLSVAYDQGSPLNVSFSSATATEDGVTCPGVGVLTCIATGESGTGSGVTAAAELSVYNQATGVWTQPSLPSMTRITSVACATTGATTNRCIAVGFGSSGAVILSSGTSSASFTADTLPTGVTLTTLSKVVCPSSTQCVAIGTTSTGYAAVISGAITASTDTWSNNAINLPNTVVGLSQLVCPTGSGGCIALGTLAAGTPTIVSGQYGTTGWTASSPNPTSPLVTLSTASNLACPTIATATNCLITGTIASGPVVVVEGSAPAGLATAAPIWTWTSDTFPSGTTPTSINGLTCPSATECLVTGATGVTSPVVLYGPITASAALAKDTLPASPAAITTIGAMACPSTVACVLLGTTASGPAILSGAIAGVGTADTWTEDTLPTQPTGYALTTLTSVSCTTNSSCTITGVGTNASGVATGFLLASSASTTTWSAIGLPTANPVLFLSGARCTQPGTGVCSAVGAGPAGAADLVSTSGPTGSWADDTPAGLGGLTTPGIPIEINNAQLVPNTYQTLITAGWTTQPANPLPPLYPFPSGYSVFAGDCQSEGQNGLNIVQDPTVPGTTSSVVVPMGLIAVQVLQLNNHVGQPYATTSMTLTTSPATSPCTAATYTLQNAGADGLSRTEVPFGAYTLTIVTAGGTTTVTGVTVGGSSVTVGAFTYPLPTPITEIVK
jgi:Tfp pilus assembly protein PilV